MMEFLDEPGSEEWGYKLFRTLKAFFENQPPLKDFFETAETRLTPLAPTWPQQRRHRDVWGGRQCW